MNYRRFLSRREQESNLELIAGLLDIEPLETVTASEGLFRRETIELVKPNFPSILRQRFVQDWPQDVLNMCNENDQAVEATIIPNIGELGAVCFAIKQHLILWTPSEQLASVQASCKAYQPKDKDIYAINALPPKENTFSNPTAQLLVVGYKDEIKLFCINCRTGDLTLGYDGYSVEISNEPTTIYGHENGRVFIGTTNGYVYELHYSLSMLGQLISKQSCALQSLTWFNPVIASSIQKIDVDSSTGHLMILGTDSTLCLYYLGEDCSSKPTFRASLRPPSFSGCSKITTVVPLSPESFAFQGMCIFADGSRVKACLSHRDGSFWDMITWASNMDLKSNLQFLTTKNPNIPLDPHHPSWSLSHALPSQDSSFWLLGQYNSTGGSSILSLLQFLDPEINKKAENCGLLFTKEFSLPGAIIQVARHNRPDSKPHRAVVAGTDLISQQLLPSSNPVYLVLCQTHLMIVEVLKPVEILSQILSALAKTSTGTDLENLREFCQMYGSVETSAMTVLTGHPLAGLILKREDLFGAPRFVEKSRWETMQPQNFPGREDTLHFHRFASDGMDLSILEKVRDLEFSDGFKGILLLLRQILKQVWWSKVFQIQKHTFTGRMHAHHAIGSEGIDFLHHAFQNLYSFLREQLSPLDPRLSERVIVAAEEENIEKFELKGIMILAKHCLEASSLLQFYRKQVHIGSVVATMSDAECEVLNEMTFKQLVIQPKVHSPVKALIKATVKLNEDRPAALDSVLRYFVDHAPSYMSPSERDELKAFHGFERLCHDTLPSRSSAPFKVINGPESYWKN